MPGSIPEVRANAGYTVVRGHHRNVAGCHDRNGGQKAGGILRIYHRDSPAIISVHEEGTIGVIMPMMGVFK
jgi:hypothetical protein